MSVRKMREPLTNHPGSAGPTSPTPGLALVARVLTEVQHDMRKMFHVLACEFRSPPASPPLPGC